MDVTDFIVSASDTLDVAVWDLLDVIDKVDGHDVRISETIVQKYIEEESLDIVSLKMQNPGEEIINIVILYSKVTSRGIKFYASRKSNEPKKLVMIRIKYSGETDAIILGDRYFQAEEEFNYSAEQLKVLKLFDLI
jgi:DNA relaxase NicK